MEEVRLLYGIKELSVTWLKSRPPILRIFGFGVARTGGWSNAVLFPNVYIEPPEDGIQTYRLCATAPPSDAVVPSVLDDTLEFSLDAPVDQLPKWMKGFRIVSENDEIEEHFPGMLAGGLETANDSGKSFFERMVTGGDWPFPGRVDKVTSSIFRLRN